MVEEPFPDGAGFYDPAFDEDPLGHDPLRDQLDALERSIEGPGLQDADLLDPLARTLDRLEAEIERTVVPPPPAQADLAPESEPGTPASDGAERLGYFSSRPPAPPEPAAHSFGMLIPPPAAVPFLTPLGLRRPGPPRRVGRSPGTRPSRRSATERRCPETGEVVDEAVQCRQCEKYDDWEGDSGPPRVLLRLVGEESRRGRGKRVGEPRDDDARA